MVPRMSHVISGARSTCKNVPGVSQTCEDPPIHGLLPTHFFSRFIVLEKYHHVDGYRNIKRAISFNSRAKLTALLSTYLLQHLQSGLAQVVQLPN